MNSVNGLLLEILSDKIKCICFSDKNIQWFHCYLTNRPFFSLDNVFLDACIINCGVTQGSILGPLLSLLHVTNDVQTTLISFYQHKVVTEIGNILNKEFLKMCKWFVDNKLSLNFGEDETECILFSREKSLPEVNIIYDNNRIKKFYIVEYLGCRLDANLGGVSMTMKSQ